LTGAHIDTTNLPDTKKIAPDTSRFVSDKVGFPAPASKHVRNYLLPEEIALRKQRICEAAVGEFVEQAEFISLGGFCGVTRSLQYLGLKDFSYPFDWVRSDVQSVIHCLDKEFRDFFAFNERTYEQRAGCEVFDTAWGGSFWHHDPSDPTVREAFERRIDRLLSRGDSVVDEALARVFCVTPNSLSDAYHVTELKEKLEKMLPEAEIFMLVFIDNQPRKAFLQVTGDDSLFFFLTDSRIFDNNGAEWTEERHAELYAEGIVLALKNWADAPGLGPKKYPSLTELLVSCRNFEGGDPQSRTYWPDAVKSRPRVSIERKQVGCGGPTSFLESIWQMIRGSGCTVSENFQDCNGAANEDWEDDEYDMVPQMRSDRSPPDNLPRRFKDAEPARPVLVKR
jgi:hypothetical protein